MNKTTDTHRLYTLLVLVIGMMLLSAGPAAAGTDVPRELDGWIYGRGAATYDGPSTSDASQREDGWVRGGGLQSLSESTAPQRLLVDGWAIGQGMRSQTVQPAQTVAEQPSSTTTPLPSLIVGLIAAALLGAAVAVVRNHRHAPSAH